MPSATQAYIVEREILSHAHSSFGVRSGSVALFAESNELIVVPPRLSGSRFLVERPRRSRTARWCPLSVSLAQRGHAPIGRRAAPEAVSVEGQL